MIGGLNLMKKGNLYFSLLSLFVLAGCSMNSGKYFQNDGPPSEWQDFRLESEDAEPKIEKPVASANRPYRVMGKKYYPQTGDKELIQVGYASWYGKQFHGNKTSIGDVYNMYEMTAAHPTMELPSYAKVTNLENGKTVIVRVNDRGPFLHSRIIDLSYAAARKLGYANKGTAKVRVERITRKKIAENSWKKSSIPKVVQVVPEKIINPPIATNKNNIDPMEEILQESQRLAEQNISKSIKPVEKQIIKEGVFVVSDGTAITSYNTPIPSQEKNDSYTVQLGVFKDKSNAERIIEKINSVNSSFNSQIKLIEQGDTYRLQLGTGHSLLHARQILEEIQEKTAIEAIVVKE